MGGAHRSSRWQAPSRVDLLNLFFLIRSLGAGGAERQLTELVKRLDVTRYRVTVATFYDGGELRPEIQGLAGVRLVSLRKKGRWDLLPFFWRLMKAVRESRPQIVHGYMGNANELCLVMAKLFGARNVWGLRSSDRDLSRYDWLTALTHRTGAWLSGLADLIIVNSFAGKRDHGASGYPLDRMIVVHNGIDTDRFRPDGQAGREMRKEWGIRADVFLIGLIGRLDPQKDHSTFLRAAALLAQERSNVHFICVGNGAASYKAQLQRLAEQLGVDRHVTWAPASRNVLGVHNALNLATLTSSHGEGFPNVVGEAMSCGIPVVTTDCGDSAIIVGNPDYIVPIGQPEALAISWRRVVDLTSERRAEMGAKQRARIVEEFNISQLVTKTMSALAHVL